MQLKVLYWNTNKKTELVKLALRSRADYDIIAIQEPCPAPTGFFPPCPSGVPYRMIYEGRTAFYVHKRHEPGTWTPISREDWCGIVFQDRTRIISVYSPREETKLGPLRHLCELDTNTPTAIVGDFNLHHPLWDEFDRTSADSDWFLAEAQRLRLELLTPKGECTRFARGDRDSTIDLAWVHPELGGRYGGCDLELTGSDHVPQILHIDPYAERREDIPTFRWKQLDPELAEAEMRARTSSLSTRIETNADIDTALTQLHEVLQRVAYVAVPCRPRSYAVKDDGWSPEVAAASRAAKRARRRYRDMPTEPRWRDYQEAVQYQKAAVKQASRKSWRDFLEQASKDTSKLWAVERWARLRSRTPPEPAHLPDLTTEPGETNPETAFAGKAKLLANKFFPPPLEIESDNTTTRPRGDTVEVLSTVTQEDVESALKRISPWKAAGPDGIPTGFVKACGAPLTKHLAKIFDVCLRIGYFPQRYRQANVVVLRKPGKKPPQYKTPAGWRPISLLNTAGKILESIVATRLASAAEEHGLLPEGQMGNRQHRSTEAAILLTTEIVRTAWDRGGIVSLLQLDFAGAFDTVNHNRLIEILRNKGLPEWLLSFIRSFLAARTARLLFDGRQSEPFDIRAGVPQGSPLSPILFLLYIATLYERLKDAPGTVTIGFADDTNIASIGRAPEQTVKQLERAWAICERWAREHGMQFNAGKSELMHFTRRRAAVTATIRLGTDTIQPVQSARLLGIQIHRKLRWNAHLAELKSKMQRQTRALTGIAASTWGCSLQRAREVYTKVIRSAIAYGAIAYHTLTKPGEPAKGIARELAATQSACLRVVTGAYKATPTHHLEAEANVPPLDLYLNQRVGQLLLRYEATGVAALLRQASARVAAIIKKRPRKRKWRRPLEEVEVGARRWLGPETPRDRNTPQAKRRLVEEWTRRWEKLEREIRPHRQHLYAADIQPRLGSKAILQRHSDLPKYISTVITQLRTGKIGLNAFLFQRRVPTITSPLCECGAARDTIYHAILSCPRTETQRLALPIPLRDAGEIRAALDRRETAEQLARWFLTLQRLPQFDLATALHLPDPGSDQTREQPGHTTQDPRREETSEPDTAVAPHLPGPGSEQVVGRPEHAARNPEREDNELGPTTALRPPDPGSE